jgi:peroxiredoxin Q/BCP
LPSDRAIPASLSKTRNTVMIDPPKATKGRRMSKKTRKKSPKASSGKPARAKSAAAAKTRPSKARLATPKKPARKSAKDTVEPSSKASHKAPSKQLKAAGSSAAPKSGLTEGAKAPAFQLPRDGGDTVSLSDFAGRKLVLFFYPRADTPGCTKEAIDFTRLASAFAETQTAILGVSADTPRAQEAFRDKHQLSTPLASDEQHATLEAYGVWGEKSMYGKTFLGVFRTTVLIDADGRIARLWRNVKVDGHADEVLAATRALQN